MTYVQLSLNPLDHDQPSAQQSFLLHKPDCAGVLQDHVVAVRQLAVPRSIIKYGADPMETELGPPTGPHQEAPALKLQESAEAYSISGADGLNVQVSLRPGLWMHWPCTQQFS